jgi:hypothetical protein
MLIGQIVQNVFAVAPPTDNVVCSENSQAL